jgi:cysteine desulfurase/selenocysteine lyase
MRSEFPIFKKHPNLIYLDSAATTHKPSCVIEALHRFYAEDYATVHRSIYRSSLLATEQYNDARETVRKFINAKSPAEIVFTRGTTDSLNLVALSWGRKYLKAGDEIVVSEMEHHSNLVPWQLLANETGASIRWIPMKPEGVLDLAGIIRPGVKFVAIGHISNVTGTINPIAEIVKLAHLVGAIVVVDGAQAAPHQPIDVQALGCDFYAFSGHKCYGPTGVGVLYGKKELLDAMPPVMGGGDMIETVTLEHTTFAPSPLRFEAGTPIIGSVIGLKCALDWMMSLGVSKIGTQETALRHQLEKNLSSIDGLRILGTAPEKGPLCTFSVDGMHPLDLAHWLDLKNIAIRSGHLCAQPTMRKFGLTAAVRVSLGVYNTPDDVNVFSDALQKFCNRFLGKKANYIPK